MKCRLPDCANATKRVGGLPQTYCCREHSVLGRKRMIAPKNKISKYKYGLQPIPKKTVDALLDYIDLKEERDEEREKYG